MTLRFARLTTVALLLSSPINAKETDRKLIRVACFEVIVQGDPSYQKPGFVIVADQLINDEVNGRVFMPGSPEAEDHKNVIVPPIPFHIRVYKNANTTAPITGDFGSPKHPDTIDVPIEIFRSQVERLVLHPADIDTNDPNVTDSATGSKFSDSYRFYWEGKQDGQSNSFEFAPTIQESSRYIGLSDNGDANHLFCDASFLAEN